MAKQRTRAGRLENRWRCDHCQKFINETHCPGSLEGIVSEGVEISFGICHKCFEAQGLEADYWDAWVARQEEKFRLRKNQEQSNDRIQGHTC